MPRKGRTQTAEATQPDVAPVVEQVAAATRTPGEDPPEHNSEPKKKWTPVENPRGWERRYTDKRDMVRLLLSKFKNEQGRVYDEAWVIRFSKPPNEMEGYSKENPHPVLKYLKEEGFRWGFDPNDNIGGHGRGCQGDPYGEDHIHARKVLAKAAEMIGAKVEQGQDIPI